MDKFEIRKTTEEDFPQLLEIYARARRFMAETGNPRQWGATNWPPEPLLHEDIRLGRSFVCVRTADNSVVGTFCYLFGDKIDQTYLSIEDGIWGYDLAYGVVHRLASDGTKGVGVYCLRWAMEKSGYMRVDTHPENHVMQNLLTKLGFIKRGIIYVEEDNDPRYAYDVFVEKERETTL